MMDGYRLAIYKRRFLMGLAHMTMKAEKLDKCCLQIGELRKWWCHLVWT
jgi:hypothetical protein